MKLYLFILIFLLTAFISCTSQSEQTKYKEVSIIPKPAQLDLTQIPSYISKKTTIIFDASNNELLNSANYLNSFLKKHYQLELGFNAKSHHTVSLIIQKISNEEEAYQIATDEKGIVIIANSEKGILHGIKTLKQLIYPAQKLIEGKLKVPGVKISDAPAYSWRGLHFDVSRHFYDKFEVMKILDGMSEVKLNIFHWHLTDDQGWRIEIKKYPLLTEIGAYRDSMIMGHMADHPSKYKIGRYGGFYTQEDIKEVVAHANKLGIIVVPEIEMPGHAVAALQAYPQFSCKGKDVPAFSEWGVSEHVFCAGNDGTFTFIEDILSEVIELFPGQYIHVGGDECPKTKWESCPKCQARMKKHGLKNEMELQSYFIKRMEKFINSKGRRLVGWNEILEGGLAEGAMVMSWQGLAGGIEAANEGHDVIMSPNAEVYLDHYQSNYYEPLAIAGLTTPREIYEWSPMPEEISDESRKHVLGAQCNVWTEYITTNDHLEYMIFPRLIALAEMLWLGEDKKDFDDFTDRMNEMYARLDGLDIKYRIPYPENLLPYIIFAEQKVSLPLTNSIPSSTILYTLNGDDPLVNGRTFSSPLDIDLENDVVLKTVTVMPSGRKSQVITTQLKYRKAHEPKKVDIKANGLNYELYKGEFSSVQNIVGECSKAIVDGISLPDDAPSTFFAVKYMGFAEVPQDGLYRFGLTANDGAVLIINNELVIDLDGFSYGKEAYGSVYLKKGLHPINLDFFQAKYGSEIKLEANLYGSDKMIELKYFH
jgi:hexosaminidase